MSERTAGTQVVEVREERTASERLVDERGTVPVLRDRIAVLDQDLRDIDFKRRFQQLAEVTSKYARQSPAELLERLADTHGLAWSEIASLIRVSDAATRKWRRGEPVTDENFERLAELNAFIEIISDQLSPIDDPAAWLGVRIAPAEATLRARDLYAAGRIDLLLEYAAQRITPHQLLDEFDPAWRDVYARDRHYEVELDTAGRPTIRPRT